MTQLDLDSEASSLCTMGLYVSEVDQQTPYVPANPNSFTVSYRRDFPDLAAKEIK